MESGRGATEPMSDESESSRVEAAHRLVPHTADVIIEATGPDRERCLEEAIAAIADVYADVVGGAGETQELSVSISAASNADLLSRVLEETLYLLDTKGVVVVDARLRAGGGGVDGVLLAVPTHAIEVRGSIPKGVAGAQLARRGDGWYARAIVDV